MILSAKLIKKPRRQRHCIERRRLIVGEQAYVYGFGLEGDPPWGMYFHPECAPTTVMEKLGLV